ncbi:PREDICTED: uncharacterized protein LOC101376543 [Odobenus rosmarus divergens]|uniref:Uncharacterized protein LOC101376543 n=1 Tax=Odobenus rosmarus divergens TaxID=9708 RepID=A0A9B0LWS0_ODORO
MASCGVLLGNEVGCSRSRRLQRQSGLGGLALAAPGGRARRTAETTVSTPPPGWQPSCRLRQALRSPTRECSQGKYRGSSEVLEGDAGGSEPRWGGWPGVSVGGSLVVRWRLRASGPSRTASDNSEADFPASCLGDTTELDGGDALQAVRGRWASPAWAAAGVGEPGRTLHPPGPGSRAPRSQRRSPAASVPAQLVPPPHPPRAALKPEREGAGRAAAGAAGQRRHWRGPGGGRAREGRAVRGGAPGARGRGGTSLPARCSRRRSEAALSPQRDLFSSSFLLNSSSRERLVVTGRAGWMGMGRGAGRSALGFWPTLAFLLCSFPAVAEELICTKVGEAAGPMESREESRLGAGESTKRSTASQSEVPRFPRISGVALPSDTKPVTGRLVDPVHWPLATLESGPWELVCRGKATERLGTTGLPAGSPQSPQQAESPAAFCYLLTSQEAARGWAPGDPAVTGSVSVAKLVSGPRADRVTRRQAWCGGGASGPPGKGDGKDKSGSCTPGRASSEPPSSRQAPSCCDLWWSPWRWCQEESSPGPSRTPGPAQSPIRFTSVSSDETAWTPPAGPSLPCWFAQPRTLALLLRLQAEAAPCLLPPRPPVCAPGRHPPPAHLPNCSHTAWPVAWPQTVPWAPASPGPGPELRPFTAPLPPPARRTCLLGLHCAPPTATLPRAPKHKIQPRPGHPGPPQPAAPHRTRRRSNRTCVCGSQEESYLWSRPTICFSSSSSAQALTPGCRRQQTWASLLLPSRGPRADPGAPTPPPVFLRLTGALLVSPCSPPRPGWVTTRGSPATVASAGLGPPVLSVSMSLSASTCRYAQPGADSPFEGIWRQVRGRLERSPSPAWAGPPLHHHLGTANPLSPSPSPSSRQLTIIFKNFQECVDQKVYQAEMDELPAAFADGSKNGGDKHGANSLKITEKVSGQHVEIQAKYIGTTIVVRQVGRYLTFAVRMPEEVVNAVEDRDSQGLYLCLRGCPLNQQIDFQAFRANAEGPRPHRPEAASPAPAAPDTFPYETAVAKCKEKLPVEDLYYQACVFDLLTTGDVNFTLAAYYALEDVKMLHSNKDRLHLYERTREPPGRAAAAGLPPAPRPLLGSLLLLALLPAFLEAVAAGQERRQPLPAGYGRLPQSCPGLCAGGKSPRAGELGLQGVGRRRNGQGQLACPDPLRSPHLPPRALLPTSPPTSAGWGEEQGLQASQPRASLAGLVPRVPSLKPVATQPGEGGLPLRALAPTSCQPGLPIRGALNQSRLCCCPREPRDQHRARLHPQKGQEGGSHSPALSWPSGLGLGAALLLFPRDLSYTGAGGSPPPLQEVPFLCPTPGQADQLRAFGGRARQRAVETLLGRGPGPPAAAFEGQQETMGLDGLSARTGVQARLPSGGREHCRPTSEGRRLDVLFQLPEEALCRWQGQTGTETGTAGAEKAAQRKPLLNCILEMKEIRQARAGVPCQPSAQRVGPSSSFAECVRLRPECEVSPKNTSEERTCSPSSPIGETHAPLTISSIRHVTVKQIVCRPTPIAVTGQNQAGMGWGVKVQEWRPKPKLDQVKGPHSLKCSFRRQADSSSMSRNSACWSR